MRPEEAKMIEHARVLELREFVDKYGDTSDVHNIWFEVNPQQGEENGK